MKFKTKAHLKDREGDAVIRREFLWLPTRFNSDPIGRWLEIGDVVYKVEKALDLYPDIPGGSHSWKWVKQRFATEDDYSQLKYVGNTCNDVSERLWCFLNSFEVWFTMATVSALLMCYKFEVGITLLLLTNLVQFVSRLIKRYNE